MGSETTPLNPLLCTYMFTIDDARGRATEWKYRLQFTASKPWCIDGTNFGKVEKTNGIETLVPRRNSKFQLKKEIEDSMVGNKSLKFVGNYIGKVKVMNNWSIEINWELFMIVSRERSTNQLL